MPTTISEFLRDANGRRWRISPDGNGQLVVGSDSLQDDDWAAASYPATTWTGTAYTVPGLTVPTVELLTDAAGTIWYLYVNTNGDLVLSTDDPLESYYANSTRVVRGAWSDHMYEDDTTETVEEAATGNEIYESLVDSLGTSWFAVPDANGNLIITTTEPT